MFHLFRAPLVRILLAVAVTIFFIESVIPVSFAVENGVLEHLQVAVLVSGAALCMMKARCAVGRYRCLWYAGILFFLLLAGRELSWGRVFFPLTETGRFPPLRSLPYGPIVHPLIGLTMVSIIALVVRGRVVSYLRAYGLPRMPFVLMAVMAFLAVDGEKLHLIPYANGVLAEEFSELCVYGLFVWMLSKMRPS